MRVRELPPLRLHVEAIVPSGRRYRWGKDEPDPADIPTGLTFESTMPGGFSQAGCTLARKPGIDYSDMQRLTTLRVLGAGADLAWEGRLEGSPRTSGDQMAITPAAVGWQAHLEDDKSAMEVYVDRDLTRWEGPSVQRRLNLIGLSFSGGDPQVTTDDATGAPSLLTALSGAWTATTKPSTEAIYRSPVPLGSLYYAWKRSTTVDNADTNWQWVARVADDDTIASSDSSGNLRASGPAVGTVVATTATRKVAFVQHLYNAAGGTDGGEYDVFWTCLAVYGTHGLIKRGTQGATTAFGYLAADVVLHAVGKWAPLLNATLNKTVLESSFIIPHLVFTDPTTAGDIITQVTAFGLQDWGVWENKTLYWAPRGTFGRKWRARIAPSQLSETGPSMDRLWNSVIVSYQDVDGSTKTVGPIGSGADTEDSTLQDDDPDNPANQLGIDRRNLLQMGVTTSAGAIQVGARFLEEQKLLDTSGQAQLVGHVEDDHGVLHPAWKVRAGDQISFIDAADTSYRRIVRAGWDDDSRTCTVDLDAPPDGLAALLERLGAVLVPLGVS